MSQSEFDKRDWATRLGKTLEQVAAGSCPGGFPFRTEHLPNPGPISLYEEEEHRQFRQLAARAKHDRHASELFEKSHLRFDSVPPEVTSILREHPLLERCWSRLGSRDGFHLQVFLSGSQVGLKSLVGNLAKSSVKLGGERVATMLHRFLVAGAHTRLHAHEITVLHGLIVDERIDLGSGAYLASYEEGRSQFDLPDEPEFQSSEMIKHLGRFNRWPSRAVLVRLVAWGGLAPCDCPAGENRSPNVKYRFPGRYSIDSWERFFGDQEVLIDLLSVAMRSRFVACINFYVLPSWMRELGPNFRLQKSGSSYSMLDVWPEDRHLSEEATATFVELAHGWLSCSDTKRRVIELAIRRIVASFGPAFGKFGIEDRILDVAIALEIMYGPFDGGEISHKLRTRAAWLLGASPDDRISIAQDMKAFYNARSSVVHGSTKADREKLERTFPIGRELARSTLTALLVKGPAPDWDRLVVSGDPSES